MKKTLLAFLPLTTLLALTGCDGTKAVTAGFKPHVKPTEFMPNSYSEALFVGESFSIKLLITPLMASDAKVVYESSNPDVVSVDANGNVFALSKGSAEVTAKAVENDKCHTSVKFYVSERVDDTYVLSNKLKQMKFYQEENVTEPEKLLTEQVKTHTLYKNGVPYSISTGYNIIAVDKPNAYVYFGGRDTVQKITDGTITREYGVWQLVTDEDYHSYIYHDTDDSSRYLPVKTEFNLGTGITRIETLYTILDSMFSTGRDLVEDTIEESLGKEWFDLSLMIKNGGYEGNSVLYCNMKQRIDDELSSPLMEQNLYIPAYIPYVEEDSFKVYWYKGNVLSFLAHFTITYNVNGDSYLLDIDERNTYTRDDFVIDPIDTSRYVKADDIFDL